MYTVEFRISCIYILKTIGKFVWPWAWLMAGGRADEQAAQIEPQYCG